MTDDEAEKCDHSTTDKTKPRQDMYSEIAQYVPKIIPIPHPPSPNSKVASRMISPTKGGENDDTSQSQCKDVLNYKISLYTDDIVNKTIQEYE